MSNRAVRFIVLLGLVSLLADVTYEGARSMAGPYLALLGASATAVGFAAGAGELLGHALRLGSGWLADRTRRYWLFTLLGYAVNLAAVPALAFAGNWQVAVVLLLAERTGKAIRTPARDVMLAHATHSVGRGWGFGLHEAMDQIGAVAGPLIVAMVLHLRRSYAVAFGVLGLPALLALAALLLARFTFPAPEDLEPAADTAGGRPFPRAVGIYIAAVGLMAAGMADFALLAFHAKRAAILSDQWIPVLYAAAMAVDAVSALVAGRMFDRRGMGALAPAAVLASAVVPLALLAGYAGLVVGVLLWGAAMGVMESTVRAALANMVPRERRGTAYGLFHAAYGFAWFGGSLLLGLLYDRGPLGAAVASAALELAAVPMLIAAKKALAKDVLATQP